MYGKHLTLYLIILVIGTPLLNTVFLTSIEMIPKFTQLMDNYAQPKFPNFSSGMVKVYPTVEQVSEKDIGALKIHEFAKEVNSEARMEYA
jgi:hypothetical protein